MQHERTRANPATLIAGPTASGKSALALTLARRTDALIINADSMQVYDVLRVITARPTDTDLAIAEHRLYGHVDPATDYSTGHWMREAGAVLDEAGPQRPVIFVGGTGLYMRALTDGLSPMPAIPGDVRHPLRERLAHEGAAALHATLAARDPQMAERLAPNDAQRIVRALEVFETTGRSLRDWQAEPGTPLIRGEAARKIIVMPERRLLHARINNRFAAMLEAGAADEVRALMARRIDPSMPAMKAIGVRELADWMNGTITLPQAQMQAQAATRQYAKRQMTWFRNQLGPDWQLVSRPGEIATD